MRTNAALVVGSPGHSRSRAVVGFFATSLNVPRTLAVELGRRSVARARIPSEGSRRVRFFLPAGQGRAVIRLGVRPGAARPGPASPGDRRFLSIRVFGLVVTTVGAQTEAERVYARVHKDRRSLVGAHAGVVDNLYLSWLFQYGIVLGGLLCIIFVGVLLRPMRSGLEGNPLAVTMQLWGLFLVLGALVVNIWEEFPVDFLVALGFGQLFASLTRARDGQARQLGFRGVRPPWRK